MYREEKPKRKSPEPVSFIKSDKLFLTIALFLLFYNAVVWNGAPLFKHRKQVMNEPGDQVFFLLFLHVYTLDALRRHMFAVKSHYACCCSVELNNCAAFAQIDPHDKCSENISPFTSFFFSFRTFVQ